MSIVSRETCTLVQRERIVRKLTGDGSPPELSLFTDRAYATQQLAKYTHAQMVNIARLRENGTSDLADQTERRVRRETETFGPLALLIADADLGQLRDMVHDDSPLLKETLSHYLDGQFNIGPMTPNAIADAIENRTHGFTHLVAPTAQKVIGALRNDHSNTIEEQLILNCGGTNEEWGKARVGSGTTHVQEMHKSRIEKGRICDSWDAFWDLHFPEEVLAKLQSCDPSTTTVSVGLAFPIESFQSPETGRTDGRVVHFASKYEGAIGPKDATSSRGNTALSSIPFAGSLRAFLHNRTGLRFQKITIVPNDTIAGKVAFATATGERYEFLVDGTGTNMSGTDANGDTVNPEMGHTSLYQSSPADMVALGMQGRTNFDTEVMISGGVLPVTFATLIRAIGGKDLYEKLPTAQGDRSKLLFDLAYSREPQILRLCSPAQRIVLTTTARKLLNRTEESLARLLAAEHRRGTKVVFGEGSMLEPDFVNAVSRRTLGHESGAGENFLQKRRPDVTFEREEDEQQYAEQLSASFIGNGQFARGDNLRTQNA